MEGYGLGAASDSEAEDEESKVILPIFPLFICSDLIDSVL